MSSLPILERWKLTEQELTIIVDQNPSLRGFLLGYIGEYKVQALLLANPDVTALRKPDDHDRRKGSKNDLTIHYKGAEFTVEVKSLQTNSIRKLADGTLVGNVQVDASDRRSVSFSDGSKVETTCLLCGEFDVLAVNVFQFKNEWEFGFILNDDLPRTTSKKYSAAQQAELLATTVKVTY